MTRQVFQDELAGSRMTQQSWDHHHQYESHKTTTFTPAQIPSHITVHQNHWSHDHKQKPICMPPPAAAERHFRYANPHWKNQRKEIGYIHDDYEQNNYSGPRWHHNDVRHRPFVPRLNETGNVPKGASKGYNPSRFRYVSDSYLRSLKENNITCSQTSQQKNVQIAIIKPIARVENLKKDEIMSSYEVASDNPKDNKNEDRSDSCKSDEVSSIKKDDTILEILDYQVVSSDICSTNEANEKQNENNLNSNCIEIRPNVSTLLKSDSNFSNKNMQVSSNIKIKHSEDPKSDIKSDIKSVTTKFALCDEGAPNLPLVISNLLVRPSLGEHITEEHITETESISNQVNVDKTFDKVNNLDDPPMVNTKFEIYPNQYKEKMKERFEPINVSTENLHTFKVTKKVVKKLSSKNSPNSSILLVAQEPPSSHSPVKCWSPRKPSQECLSHKESTQDKNLIKNMKADISEYLSVKPFSPSKKPELHSTQRINQNDLHEIPFQTLNKSPSNKNFKSLNSDVLTPEMLRERLFRKFINGSELIIPVENEVQDQNFLIEREKTIESLMSSTLKIAGIFPEDVKEPPKQDKPPLSIKTEIGILSNISTSNTIEDQSSSKQLNPKSKIEKRADSFNENLPLNLFNENTLKILSNVNLLTNLDIHLLKDILAKIETPSIESISEIRKNTESVLNCENSNLKNISVTNNSKVNYVNDTAIKPEYLKIESNQYENMMSPEINQAALPLNEEDIDTSLMLNLESVEECMLNSVSVVCLQSEIWENNELDKKDANCIKSEIICEQIQATETSPSNRVETNRNHSLSKTEIATEIICENPLDSLKNLGCTLEESRRAEGNVSSDAKNVPDCNSSLNICSSNNEILINDIDVELSTIEYNLNQLFGMKEENNILVPEEQSENVIYEQNKLKPIKNVELLNEDVQSGTTDDLPTQIEPMCKFFISENGISTPEIADKSIYHDKSYFIEYSPSIKVTDNHDSISISSDEVGDGDDCFLGEENFDIRQPNDNSKLVEDENQGADEDLEISKSLIITSLNENKIDNDFTSNMNNVEKDKFDFDNNNKTDLLGHDNKLSGFEKSQFYESNEFSKTFETDDDLPDLNKTNLEKSYNHETEDKKECNFYRKENVPKSANGSFISERTFVSGTSDLHKTDILKWKVSKKRAYIFSKENIQSFQVTGSSKKYSQKQSDVNYFVRDTLTPESIKFEKGNDVSSQRNGLLEQVNCNLNKMTNNSPVKLKRLYDSDFSEHIPKKKVNMKTSLKCKPKDRKIKINRVSTCLSPKSLSKALETSSYIIEDEVSNICPLGHSLEKCYSSVNVNTDRISIYCKSCKKTILMGEST